MFCMGFVFYTLERYEGTITPHLLANDIENTGFRLLSLHFDEPSMKILK